MANSAPGIDTIVTFNAGDASPDEFSISIPLTDDDIALEDIEMYTARLEIVGSPNVVVMLGIPDETVINVVDDDGKIYSGSILGGNQAFGQFFLILVTTLSRLLVILCRDGPSPPVVKSIESVICSDDLFNLWSTLLDFWSQPIHK